MTEQIDSSISDSVVAIPPHKAGLFITHNEHLNYYQTVAQMFDEQPDRYEVDYFMHADDRQRCIDSNELWSMQWYPDTPIGSYTIFASTLDLLSVFARQQSKEA